MSGGSGGGGSSEDWRPPSGGSGGDNDKCAIVERTVLNSPVSAVVSGLNAGDVLTIELETTPRNRVVAKEPKSNQVAGAITSPRLVTMIECLQDGYFYEAEVMSVQGGRIEIEVRPA